MFKFKFQNNGTADCLFWPIWRQIQNGDFILHKKSSTLRYQVPVEKIMAHFLKFLVVGTLGFIINTVVLIFGVRIGFNPSVSGPAGAELAIISNFLFNNFWTFSDKSITSLNTGISKFVQFNILSFGSVLIQFTFLKIGEKIFGLATFKEPLVSYPFIANLGLTKWLLTLPLIPKLTPKLSFYMIFYMTGVGVGIIVNYFIYSNIIWK